MNFGFNDEQELLRSTARKFFENECPSELVRRSWTTPEGITAGALEEARRAGLAGPDLSRGSTTASGSGFVDLVVLMEEMGRAVDARARTSRPCCSAASPILEAGSDAQKKEWLPRIAAGDKRVTLAWMEPSATLGRRRA